MKMMRAQLDFFPGNIYKLEFSDVYIFIKSISLANVS